MFKTLLILLIAFNIYANKNVDGEGKFLASDDDKLPLIKSQLLYDAFRQVLDVELKQMGLDSQTFWRNYDEKFNEHFKDIELSVEEKYKVPEGQTLTAQKLEAKEKEIREKRLTSKAKFGRLNKAIKSYSITKMSKSVRVPNSHFINISAQIDRKDLTDIYYKFIGVSKYRKLNKLFISSNFVLGDTNWFELGVDLESDFTNVVNNTWLKYLGDKLQAVFDGGIEIANDNTKKEINERLKKTKEVLLSESNDSEISDSLSMDIEVNIRKINLDQELKKITLNFSGGVTLIDLKTNTIVSYFDFPVEKASFDTTDQHKLNSEIATLVYRMPILYLGEIRKTVEENTRVNDQVEIVLRKTKNINEAFTFAQKLKEKGILLYFNTKVTDINMSDVKIKLAFSGEKEKAIEILNQMTNEKLNDERIITKDSALPFVFNIESLSKPEGAVNNGI